MVKVTPEDRKATAAIRLRDKNTCQRCLSHYPDGGKGLHTAHVFSRTRKATRHDPENLICLCYGCHSYYHRNPLEFHKFMRKRLGKKRYDALTLKANSTKRGSGDA